MVTHAEPDSLVCEGKCTLGSSTMNKASGDDGIPAKLFKVLKHNAVKLLHSIHQQIWKTAVATKLENISVHSNPKERQCQRIFRQ